MKRGTQLSNVQARYREKIVTKEELDKIIPFAPTMEYVVAYLGISRAAFYDAIRTHYGVDSWLEVSRQKNHPYVRNLLYKAYELAMGGNVQMLKYLLGHYAGIVETHKVEMNVQKFELSYNLDVPPDEPMMKNVNDTSDQ